MVLLNPQITNRVVGCTDGSEQLRLAVKQGLAPLGVAGSNDQRPAPERQRLTMAGIAKASILNFKASLRCIDFD